MLCYGCEWLDKVEEVSLGYGFLVVVNGWRAGDGFLVILDVLVESVEDRNVWRLFSGIGWLIVGFEGGWFVFVFLLLLL